MIDTEMGAEQPSLVPRLFAAEVTMDTVADPVDPRTGRFDRFVQATELPLALLALLIVPALVLEDHAKDLKIRELRSAEGDP